MNIDVTSVSRKEQKLSKIPAAVYVITQEAIRRSSATSIPDLLRMVPGVQVAQVEANRWAVSVRGFNGIYSNKLLVLVDGRTVYSPSFSGVYWDQLYLPFDTIERIEVIRGPGATVWGANAVNGVINILTKNAADTQGTSLGVGAGSHMTSDLEARFGGKLGDVGAYRILGGFRSVSSLPLADGRSGRDGLHSGMGGFRADLKAGTKDSFLFEGNLFSEGGGQSLAKIAAPPRPAIFEDIETKSFSMSGRWTRRHSDRSESSLQLYDSGYERVDSHMKEAMNLFDLDFQNHLQAGSRNDVVWGGGFRISSDNIRPAASMEDSFAQLGMFPQVVPPRKSYSLLSGFVQDEISLSSRLALTIGSKFERNSFTGFEYEPSIKLAWNPKDSLTFWVSAAKPVRLPSRLETGIGVAMPPMFLAPNLIFNQTLSGNSAIVSESVHDYEAGLRIMPTARLSLDFAGFGSQYRNLTTSYPGIPSFSMLTGGIAVLNLPIVYGNGTGARSYGGEANATWNVVPRWKLTGGYSWLNIYQTATPPMARAGIDTLSSLFGPESMAYFLQSLGTEQLSYLDYGSPRNQFSVQSYFDLSSKWTFDVSTYYTSHLAKVGIPAHTRLDARLGYALGKNVRFSLIGQDLLTPRHLEFEDTQQLKSTQVERSVFGRITWTF